MTDNGIAETCDPVEDAVHVYPLYGLGNISSMDSAAGAARSVTSTIRTSSFTTRSNDMSPHYGEPPRARTDDPDTSQAGMSPQNIARLQQMIVGALKLHSNGMTCGELALYLDFPRDSISPRMRTLEYHNLIEETTLRRTLPKGRPQIVWVFKKR